MEEKMNQINEFCQLDSQIKKVILAIDLKREGEREIHLIEIILPSSIIQYI